jgi:outer membrane protein OmpA-like peptidoglycan-associated protein
MRWDSIISVIIMLGLVVSGSLPLGGEAGQQGQFTDFRGRSDYTDEDLAKSLFPEAQSDVRMRGIGAVGTQSPPADQPTAKASVALNVFFEFNSDKILTEYYPDIDKLGKVLTAPQYNSYRVQIEGHTDSVGADGYNQVLSQRRAESVKRYLIQKFPVKADRLVVRGYGESRPMASNDTNEGRGQNRRVEVVNLGQQ